MIGTLKDMIRDMEHGTYDLTKNGECIGCGACCSNLLPMTDKEVKTIRRYIRRYGIKARKSLIPTRKPVLDMQCPFLRQDTKKDKCLIYECRPEICRSFKCDKASKGEWHDGNTDGMRIVNLREEFYGK